MEALSPRVQAAVLCVLDLKGEELGQFKRWWAEQAKQAEQAEQAGQGRDRLAAS